MRILITGGCGFLGSNLAAEVLFKGKDELFVFDNLTRNGSVDNNNWLQSKGKFKHFKLDIRNKNDIGFVIKDVKPDVVFHLAGQVAMTTSLKDPRIDFETNALGTFNLLDSIRMYSPEGIIVYSSTNKVYGDLEYIEYKELDTRYSAVDYPNGFSEELNLNFQSPYGCSKGSADQYMLDYYRMFGIRTVVFRHSSMFGGRQFSTIDQGWIGWFCEKAVETKYNNLKEPFTISGNGKQVRDVLFASDMVSLYFDAIQHIDIVKGQAFNIGGGISNSLSLLELFDLLEFELNTNLNYIMISPRVSDQKVFIADISKAKNLIGWQPKINKKTGIKKMIKWITEQHEK